MIQLTEAFNAQADACENLDSPFTALLLRQVAKNLGDDHPVGAHLHNWPDYDNFRSGAVALRLAGALHSLVLLKMDAELAKVYPPNICTPDELWKVVNCAMKQHHEHIIGWMTSPPQTNEIRRCNALIPAFHLIAKETGLPLLLSEIGASAGLNLNWDRYSMQLDDQLWGPEDAVVQFNPDWDGPMPPHADISILERKGCDVNPLDPSSEQDRLRMLSYIWPDQFQRIENTKRAFDLAQETKNTVRKEDAITFLKHRLKPQIGATRVIYHSIMWQYLSAKDQAEGEEMIRAAGADASAKTPIAWLRAEADERLAKGAAITLNIWPTGETRDLGRMDFHGRWINWNDGS